MIGNVWLLPSTTRSSFFKVLVCSEVLDQCEKDGREAAAIAVRGACATLTRICPAKKSPGRTPAPAGISSKSIEGKGLKMNRYRFSLLLETSGGAWAIGAYLTLDCFDDSDTVKRTCKILFEDACIRGGFDVALSRNDDCASILSSGPDDSLNVPDCPDFNAAVDIFQADLERACVE